MPHDYTRINYLLERFTQNDCSLNELHELMTEIQQVGDESSLDPALLANWRQSQYAVSNTDPIRKTIYANIIPSLRTSTEDNQPPVNYKWLRVAAAVLLLSGLATWLWQSGRKPAQNTAVITKRASPDPAAVPGGNKATLTLADGTVHVLDNTENGDVAVQGNIRIVKSTNGLLTFKADQTIKLSASASQLSAAQIAYNTVATPKGGQYQVILPDGSKVWLNASSSVSFPAAFTEKQRMVEVAGEAYFEVAKDRVHPFTVKAGDAMVDVLGTRFNINSYSDEDHMQTTLLEGSVKVSRKGVGRVMEPGQTAKMKFGPQGEVKVSADPDAAGAIAWVNGFFHFENADIHTVMRQLARWYDIEVEFKTGVNAKLDKFGGDIERNLPLPAVLKILETSQVHVKMEDKKLIVMP